jgi:hypothetical protein
MVEWQPLVWHPIPRLSQSLPILVLRAAGGHGSSWPCLFDGILRDGRVGMDRCYTIYDRSSGGAQTLEGDESSAGAATAAAVAAIVTTDADASTLVIAAM